MSKKKGDSTSTTLETHSRAKVDLFKLYLGIYLNNLGRATRINHLMFFDLCSGGGHIWGSHRINKAGNHYRVTNYPNIA